MYFLLSVVKNIKGIVYYIMAINNKKSPKNV